jgi:hypothetical protein
VREGGKEGGREGGREGRREGGKEGGRERGKEGYLQGQESFHPLDLPDPVRAQIQNPKVMEPVQA